MGWTPPYKAFIPLVVGGISLLKTAYVLLVLPEVVMSMLAHHVSVCALVCLWVVESKWENKGGGGEYS